MSDSPSTENDLLMEQLIEEVRNYPALYDTNHMDYMNIRVKHSIWNEIASTSGFKTGVVAKNAWLKLRNCHRDAIRRQRRMRRRLGGDAAVSLKDWKYQRQMEFLMPYMFSRRSLVKREPERGPGKQEELLANSDEFDSGHRLFKPELPGFRDDDAPNEDCDYIDAGGFLKLQHEGADEKAPPSKGSDAGAGSGSEVSQDPLYHFFMSMYASTKRMPPQSQHKVRLQVFTTVSNAEAELFNIAPYTTE